MKLIVIFILMSGPAFADSFLDANLVSYHWDRRAVSELNLEEVNPGIGYENDNVLDENGTRFTAMIGAYHNSVHRTALYALMGYLPMEWRAVRVGLVFGVINGAKIGNSAPSNAPVPAGGIIFTYQPSDFGANIVLTPNAPQLGLYGFAGLQLRYKLKP